MATTIRVREKSRPTIYFKVPNRDPRSNDPVNITGWTARFIVKQSLELDDARAYFDDSMSIASPATDGVFSLALTLKHTAMPAGTYQGEIRWWNSASQTPPPLDAERITFIIEEAVDKVV